MAIGATVSAARAKVFNKKWRESAPVKALFEEHKKAVGSQRFAPDGYPDTGSGRYSATLDYSDWLAFNNAQRAHQNMLEGLSSVLALLVTAGAFHPVTASRLAAVYALGRLVYAVGYIRGGASGRLAGVMLAHVGDLGLLGVAVSAGAKLAGLL
jgi:glutathione S-transferase